MDCATVQVADLFPESPRFVFTKAPLTFVVAQLRFPTLLLIEKEPPAAFQERIRAKFPFFERKPFNPLAINPPTDISANLSQFFGNFANKAQYSFSTVDRLMTLDLSPDAISLTAFGKGYTRWEEFSSTLHEPLRALIELYRPNFFMSVGLRYQDAISRKNLNLGDALWSSLIRNELLGEMAIPAFERSVDGVANRALKLRLPDDNGSMLFQHGLGTIPQPSGQPEIGYVIDMDFSKASNTGLDDAEPILNTYHDLAGRTFRWAILDPLRVALEPHAPE